ncbi:MAG: SHOCT domain-containing protein [Betaproteobacteria bacterium]|nr:SHOCT domain-containing protein [Betaproteobacteria bacterium]
MSLDLNFLGSTAGAWWVFWVAVAGWLIFLGLGPFGKTGSRRGTAQEELLRRLEDGEISREDYERRLRLLGDDPSQSR